MVRVISQETFEDIVKENMEEFEMSREEAVREAKEQFEQQGVNLTNIVISEKGSHEVLDALNKLQPSSSIQEKVENLQLIADKCKDDLAQRVLATNNGAYSFLTRFAGKSEDLVVRKESLKCLAVVMDTNPDHLESQGISLLKESLEEDDLKIHALDWLLVCCVRHEGNRQNIVNSGLLDSTSIIAKSGSRDHLLRVKRVWMALVQDDDIRVPFGKAHDHARDIVENHEALSILTNSLTQFAQDKELLCLTLSALASLAVRNEYCQEIVDGGGLKFIHDILLNHRSEAELVTRSLVLLKVLAGNDNVKSDIAKGGGIPLIMASIEDHMQRPVTVDNGFQAIAAICLRQPENSAQVLESDGAQLIITAQSRHPENRRVQAACASAIRNIVCRDKGLGAQFIDLGVEDLLNLALLKHGDKVGDTLKSALRDLDLKVELKERWTGAKPPGLED
ncbi:armadillo repeat-containing protein 6 [Eurytemora carolleeae]|uniref:armadillo repeat-containing protein 6 n=1 Tax=Eurytemora carolleeae TaxID=1294199 RepID=UPI000C781DCF|nr:armadillo repeat-containing protein 6 [Eurytemora carolleeae]|eukprot:XP_023322074.1 armadillo repeat-containing protein 6-like [Eurytemora affinis]